MSDDIRLETAWNLYRAIRTYDTVQEALCAVREAVIGQREARGQDERVFDPNSPDDASFRYTALETANLVRHAHYIVSRHNLDEARVIDVISEKGVIALTWAVDHELREGVATNREWFFAGQVMTLIPFPSLSLTSPTKNLITINPIAYRDEQAFMAHMVQELPLLYRHIQAESVAVHTHAAEAKALAEEKHTKKVESVLATLNKRSTTALHKVWENGDAIPDALWLRFLPPDDPDLSHWRVGRDDAAMRAALGKIRFPDSRITFALQYCVYHVPTRCWYQWTRRIRRTAENKEWRDSPLPADLNELAAPLRKGRKNPYDELPKHARWWAMYCADGVSKNKLAKDDVVGHATVIQAVKGLERRFNVT